MDLSQRCCLTNMVHIIADGLFNVLLLFVFCYVFLCVPLFIYCVADINPLRLGYVS